MGCREAADLTPELLRFFNSSDKMPFSPIQQILRPPLNDTELEEITIENDHLWQKSHEDTYGNIEEPVEELISTTANARKLVKKRYKHIKRKYKPRRRDEVK